MCSTKQEIKFAHSSLITHRLGENCQVELAYCFCVDQLNNILIGDYVAGCIKVFSQDGVLLHTLGGDQKGHRFIIF